MGRGRLLISGVLLAMVCARAAQFVDTFRTFPTAAGRRPFLWDQFSGFDGEGSPWRAGNGVMEYRAEEQTATHAGFTFDDGEPVISPSSCCSFIRSSRTGCSRTTAPASSS
jgi:hypothetical protein